MAVNQRHLTGKGRKPRRPFCQAEIEMDSQTQAVAAESRRFLPSIVVFPLNQTRPDIPEGRAQAHHKRQCDGDSASFHRVTNVTFSHYVRKHSHNLTRIAGARLWLALIYNATCQRGLGPCNPAEAPSLSEWLKCKMSVLSNYPDLLPRCDRCYVYSS